METMDEVRTVLEPLLDRIIVQPMEADDEKMIGSLFVPDTANDPQSMGEVIAVGPGPYLADGTVRPMRISEGDLVLYGKYSGSDAGVDGEGYLILREEDVLARVHEVPITDDDFKL